MNYYLTKTVARNIIEDIFSVEVLSINTSILSSKKRRLGKFLGFKNSFKRILITLIGLLKSIKRKFFIIKNFRNNFSLLIVNILLKLN